MKISFCLAALLAGALLGFGFLMPLGRVLIEAYGGFFDPDVLWIARFTAEQALLSALFSLVLGFPLGVLTGRLSANARDRVERIFLIPVAFPGIVVAAAWLQILGASATTAAWLYSLPAVYLAHVFLNAPWIAYMTSQAVSRVSSAEREAARLLGASAPEILKRLILPEVMPAVARATLQSFAWCAMSFSIILLLGGGAPVETLEVALYSSVRYGLVDRSAAGAIAAWQFFLIFVPGALMFLLFQKQTQRRRESSPSSFGQTGGTSVVGILLGLSALVFVSPVLGSVVQSGFRLWSDARSIAGEVILGPLLRAWWGSAALALSSASVALFLSAFLCGVAVRYPKLRAVSEILGALPSGVSALTLALGLWLSPLDPLAHGEGARLLALIVLQGVTLVPMVHRILLPVSERWEQFSWEAARTLGATPRQAFWVVEWPKFRGPVFSAWTLSSAMGLGDLGLILFFAPSILKTLPLQIADWSMKYEFERAQLGSLLLLATAAVLVSGSRRGNRARD